MLETNGEEKKKFLKGRGYDSPELTNGESATRKVTPEQPKKFKKAVTEKLVEIAKDEKPRTEPIWPTSDEDLVKWKAWMKDAPKRAAEQLKVNTKKEREKKEWTIKKEVLLKEIRELQEQINAKRPAKRGRKKGSKKKERVVSLRPPRQQRLGQTKLIDKLLDKKMTDLEIFNEVQKEIPDYPKEKLPKLIKLRKYHQKKRLP